MCTKPECQVSLGTAARWAQTNSVPGGMCTQASPPCPLHACALALILSCLDRCRSLLNKAWVSRQFYRPLRGSTAIFLNHRSGQASSPVLLRHPAFPLSLHWYPRICTLSALLFAPQLSLNRLKLFFKGFKLFFFSQPSPEQ